MSQTLPKRSVVVPVLLTGLSSLHVTRWLSQASSHKPQVLFLSLFLTLSAIVPQTIQACVQSTINVDPTTLSAQIIQGDSIDDLTFKVWKGEIGTLHYRITADESWLKIEGSSVKPPAYFDGESIGEQDIIHVNFDTSSLGFGNHTATITIADKYGPASRTINVTLTVNRPLCILKNQLKVSGQTFSIPLDPQQTTADYYRTQAGLTAATVIDQDEMRVWNPSISDYGPWQIITDTTPASPVWTYSPSGTISAPCTITATCTWTDNNSPAGTQDAQVTDTVYIDVHGVPDPPDNLSATDISSSRIDLQWDDVDNETGYTLYRSEDATNFVAIAEIAANVTYFKDEDLQSWSLYFYEILATNSLGNSDFSDVSSAMTKGPDYFRETWNSVTEPIYPNAYSPDTTGSVTDSDENWTYTTANSSVEDCGVRETGTSDYQMGRFASGSAAGDFTLEAPAGSYNFSDGENLTVSFEASIDATGEESFRDFNCLVLNETSYTASAPTYISVSLNAETDQKTLKIVASDEGDASNALETPLGIGSYGGMGTYRVDVTFSPGENEIGVSYSLTDEDNPAQPVVSGTGTLNIVPSENLHKIRLNFPQRAVGALDNITLSVLAESIPLQQMRMLLFGDPEVSYGTEEPLSFDTNGPGGSLRISSDEFNDGEMGGYSLSAIGDINADGCEDVLLGVPWAAGGSDETLWYPWVGKSYLIFGSPDGIMPNARSLAPVHESTTQLLSPPVFAAGASVAGVGDFNGDEVKDFAIGAPWGMSDNIDNITNGPASRSGEVYLVYGGVGAVGNLSVPDPDDDKACLIIEGESPDDSAGHSLAFAGDVNGDGFDDILIGAPGFDIGNDIKDRNAGCAYLVFGGSEVGNSSGVLELNGGNVLRLRGEAGGDRAGNSVAGAGDVNGDGYFDILIGAPGADPDEAKAEAGKAYLIYGRPYLSQGDYSLSAVDGANGVVFHGEASYDHLGQQIAGIGNANGDASACDDFLIAAPAADVATTKNAGKVYLVLGDRPAPLHFNRVFDFAYPPGSNWGAKYQGGAANGHAGASIASAGDINRDSHFDFIVGAPGEGTSQTGKIYTVHGGAAYSGATVSIATAASSSVDGLSEKYALGGATAFAGDMNADGQADHIASASAGQDQRGEACFFLGDTPASSDFAVYRSAIRGGDAPNRPIGAVSAADPGSGCWMDYAQGDPSVETVQRWKSKSEIENFTYPADFDSSQVADVVWKIYSRVLDENFPNSSSRNQQAWVTFKYSDAAVQGISEESLELWESPATTTPESWTKLAGSSVLPDLNRIQGTTTPLGKYYLITGDTLAAPTNLQAEAVSDTRIELSWYDNSDNEQCFVVKRRKNPGGAWASIAQLPGKDGTSHMSYSDQSGLVECINNDEYYEYQVFADGTTPSNCATAKTLPAAPVLTAQLVDGRAELTWNSTPWTQYEIRRALPEKPYLPVLPVYGSPWTDPYNLPQGRTYYTIRVFRNGLASAPSNAASVTVKSQKKIEPPAANDPKTSAALFFEHAAYYKLYGENYSGYNVDFINPSEYNDKYIKDYDTGDTDKREADVVAALCMTYYIMKEEWAGDNDKLKSFFKLLDQRAQILYNYWESENSHRCYSNKPIRQIAAFTMAGLILHDLPEVTFDPPLTVAEVEERGDDMLWAGLEPPSPPTNPDPDTAGALLKVFTTSFHKRTISDDGVCTEGPGYAYYENEILALAIYLLNHDPYAQATFPGQIEDINKYFAKHVKWLVQTQRPDGRWSSVDDSALAEYFPKSHVLYTLYKDLPAFLDPEDHDLPQLIQWAETKAFKRQDGLDGANLLLFPMAPYPGNSDIPPIALRNLANSGRDLYMKGGQAHMRSTISSSIKAMHGMLLNEGAWHYPESTNIAVAIELDDYQNKSLETPASWFSSDSTKKPDHQRLYRAIDSSMTIDDQPHPAYPLYFRYTPKLSAHKRFNDTHFEIFAYGKSLLIGPGYMEYNKKWQGHSFNAAFGHRKFNAVEGTEDKHIPTPQEPPDYPSPNFEYSYIQHKTGGAREATAAYWPYNDFNHPDAYNMVKMGDSADEARYPVTKITKTVNSVTEETHKIFKGSGTGDFTDCHVYAATSDKYTRYVLWARERYFVVFDWSETPKYMEARFHGRGELKPDDTLEIPNTEIAGNPVNKYPVWRWDYLEKRGDYDVGVDGEIINEDENIDLFVFSGNPQERVDQSNSVILTNFNALVNAGKDSGEDEAKAFSKDPLDKEETNREALLLVTDPVAKIYKWTPSSSVPGAFYLEHGKDLGGNPHLDAPSDIIIGSAIGQKVLSPLNVLAANQWSYGNVDSLAEGGILFDTIYVRLADGADPDGLGEGYINVPRARNFFKHDVLQITVPEAHKQRGMVNLFWPRNSIFSTTLPDISWTYKPDDNDPNQIETLYLSVDYENTTDGGEIHDRWQFPVKNGIPIEEENDMVNFNSIVRESGQ